MSEDTGERQPMTEDAGSSEESQKQAKAMGWVPKEEFRGSEDSWVDADEFVRRGEEIMPILRSNNRKLQDQVGNLASELNSTKQALAASQEAISELREFNTTIALEKAKDTRSELAQRLKQARADNDVEAEVEIQDQLSANATAIREAEAAPRKRADNSENSRRADEAAATIQPEVIAWTKENPWFDEKSDQFDQDKADTAMVVAARLRQKGIKGQALLDKVSEEIERKYPSGGNRRSASKVDGGSNGGGHEDGEGGSGDSGNRGYASLPHEAKAACERMAKKMKFGEGRNFKDVADYRAKYAKTYYS
jgi:regulator of replication initiation timing